MNYFDAVTGSTCTARIESDCVEECTTTPSTCDLCWCSVEHSSVCDCSRMGFETYSKSDDTVSLAGSCLEIALRNTV